MKKISLALVLMLFSISIIAQEEEAIKQKFIEETLIEAPVFGSHMDATEATQGTLNQYLQKELSYLAQNEYFDNEGIVAVEFIIKSNGDVSNARISNSLSDVLDQAVLDAINNSSQLWRPGKINGAATDMEKTVFVKFDIPGNATHNQLAIDYLNRAVKQVYGIEYLQQLPIAMDKQARKTSRKARYAESYLAKAEQYKPNDLSITFWQAKVYELQGRNELMHQQLDKYLELVHYQQYEENLINEYDMAVITLK